MIRLGYIVDRDLIRIVAVEDTEIADARCVDGVAVLGGGLQFRMQEKLNSHSHRQIQRLCKVRTVRRGGRSRRQLMSFPVAAYSFTVLAARSEIMSSLDFTSKQ